MANWNYLDIQIGYDLPVAIFEISLLYEFSTYNQYLISNSSQYYTNTLGDCTIYWDFGDGTNSTSTSYTFLKNYYSNGTYTITMTLTDPLGRSNTTSRTIEVSI